MKRILLALATLGLATVVLAATEAHTNALIDRIKPSGNVCVSGQPCDTAQVSTTTVAQAARDGATVYQQACLACHMTGAAGAPVMGNAGAWASRLDKGMDTLIANAINGIGAMPAKGGCGNCSDEEVAAATEYLVNNSR